jgi:hypothetical protein
MAWLSWFSRKMPAQVPAPFESSMMGLTEAASLAPAQPVSADVVPGSKRGSASHRKIERLERRELLYTVVREAMTRAGVLSASYKFKVLSLESRGRQYLIMMDLANRSVTEVGRLAEIETLIAQAAQKRHSIVVTAVYWRYRDQAHPVMPASPPVPRRTMEESDEEFGVPPAFQDTEVAPRETKPSPLSVTQYGDLV